MKRNAHRVLLVAAGLACAAPPLSAQPAPAIVGSWNGVIEQADGTADLTYVDIDLDERGRPIGNVEYEGRRCTAVWMGATRQGSTWRFEETVTGGRERCPGPVVATITEIEGLTDAIEITVRGTGIAGAGTGEFYRIDDSLLEEDYAQASGAGAGARTLDPLVAELLAEPARCNPGETGTDFLHAENERWFIAGEPIYFGDGPDYVKQGLPRVISAGDLAPFEIHSGVAVYVDAGVEDEEPETVYLLVGAPPRQRAAGECQYQPYRLAQD